MDYEETYALVTRLASIRVLLAIAAANSLKVDQLDVDSAYLNRIIDKEIYMRQPPSYKDSQHPDWVWKLHKSLYGLKQAGRI